MVIVQVGSKAFQLERLVYFHSGHYPKVVLVCPDEGTTEIPLADVEAAALKGFLATGAVLGRDYIGACGTSGDTCIYLYDIPLTNPETDKPDAAD